MAAEPVKIRTATADDTVVMADYYLNVRTDAELTAEMVEDGWLGEIHQSDASVDVNDLLRALETIRAELVTPTPQEGTIR